MPKLANAVNLRNFEKVPPQVCEHGEHIVITFQKNKNEIMNKKLHLLFLLLSLACGTAKALTWTAASTNSPLYEDIAYGDGVFVAAGPAPLAYSLNNGLTWTNVSPNQGAWDTGIAYGAGVFVAAGPNKSQTSTDGINWAMGGVEHGRTGIHK